MIKVELIRPATKLFIIYPLYAQNANMQLTQYKQYNTTIHSEGICPIPQTPGLDGPKQSAAKLATAR